MSYSEYLLNIALQLIRLGVPKEIANEKAKSCRGLYWNRNKYTPIKKAVGIAARSIPLCYFSIGGLMELQREKLRDYDEVERFLTTCQNGRKGSPLIYEL